MALILLFEVKRGINHSQQDETNKYAACTSPPRQTTATATTSVGSNITKLGSNKICPMFAEH